MNVVPRQHAAQLIVQPTGHGQPLLHGHVIRHVEYLQRFLNSFRCQNQPKLGTGVAGIGRVEPRAETLRTRISRLSRNPCVIANSPWNRCIRLLVVAKESIQSETPDLSDHALDVFAPLFQQRLSISRVAGRTIAQSC